jgi:hypothetical protein
MDDYLVWATSASLPDLVGAKAQAGRAQMDPHSALKSWDDPANAGKYLTP